MSLSRTLSLAASLVGAVFNFAFALRLLALYRSLGGEGETDWESSLDVWAVDSVRLVWGLLFAYFAVASASCFVGFVGLARHVRLFVRIYRDYSIADFVFVTLATVAACYTTFNSPSLRSSVCEELSRHPELMRDLGEMGLSMENCELWCERAVVAAIGMMFILIVVRLHIVIALSQYYSAISRHLASSTSTRGLGLGIRALDRAVALQRVFLMPTPMTDAPSSSHPLAADAGASVYAMVRVGGVTEEEARRMHATEAWVATSPVVGAAGSPRAHAHVRRHSHSHSHGHRGPSQSHSHAHGYQDGGRGEEKTKTGWGGDEKVWLGA